MILPLFGTFRPLVTSHHWLVLAEKAAVTVCVLQPQPRAREGFCARPCVGHAAHTSSFPEVPEPECWFFRLVCAGRCLADQFAVQASSHLSDENQSRVSTLHCATCTAVGTPVNTYHKLARTTIAVYAKYSNVGTPCGDDWCFRRC